MIKLPPRFLSELFMRALDTQPKKESPKIQVKEISFAYNSRVIKMQAMHI